MKADWNIFLVHLIFWNLDTEVLIYLLIVWYKTTPSLVDAGEKKNEKEEWNNGENYFNFKQGHLSKQKW